MMDPAPVPDPAPALVLGRLLRRTPQGDEIWIFTGTYPPEDDAPDPDDPENPDNPNQGNPTGSPDGTDNGPTGKDPTGGPGGTNTSDWFDGGPVTVVIPDELHYSEASFFILDEDGNRIDPTNNGDWTLTFTPLSDSPFRIVMIVDGDFEVPKDLLPFAVYPEKEFFHWIILAIDVLNICAAIIFRRKKKILIVDAAVSNVANIVLAIIILNCPWCWSATAVGTFASCIYLINTYKKNEEEVEVE